MHYAIIEDPYSDQKTLTEMIRQGSIANGEEVELSCYPDGESFFHDFRPGFCSAVFVDIILGMGKLDGIQTAKRIRDADKYLPIIFITAEQDYALAGYRVHPLDYLTKPVNQDDLNWCLKELRDHLARPAWFEVSVSSGQGAAAQSRHIFLDDFLYAETSDRRLILHTAQGDITARLSLSELSGLLPETGRFQITGQGHLVNFSQVSAIQDDGKILLKDGQSYFCSRRKLRETQQAFHRYLFSGPRNTPAAKRFLMKHQTAEEKK